MEYSIMSSPASMKTSRPSLRHVVQTKDIFNEAPLKENSSLFPIKRLRPLEEEKFSSEGLNEKIYTSLITKLDDMKPDSSRTYQLHNFSKRFIVSLLMCDIQGLNNIMIKTPGLQGGVYSGPFEKECFHGQGKFTFDMGQTYQGGFANGKLHGNAQISCGSWTSKGWRFENNKCVEFPTQMIGPSHINASQKEREGILGIMANPFFNFICGDDSFGSTQITG